MFRKILILLVTILFSGCATARKSLIVEMLPSDAIVLIFTHGSGPAKVPDDCKLDINVWPGTPYVMADLDGMRRNGKTIALVKYCTPSKTGTPLSQLHENLDSSKIMRRTNDLITLARAYRDAGFPKDRIILTGHSAGGFASLLAQAMAPELIGKVIAFAPAFAGKRQGRNAGEIRANIRLKALIAHAPKLDALVYAFDGDDYERPEDLQEWSSNPGIRIIPVRGFSSNGERCTSGNAHQLVYDSCFRDTQLSTLCEFIFSE